MAVSHPDCGDLTCELCHPPRERCVTCGALHDKPDVPFCSLECAIAGEPVPEEPRPR